MAQDNNRLSIESTQPNLLNDAADILQVGCVATDEDLVITGWNRWMEAATGQSAAHAVGKKLTTVFPELVETPAERAFHRALGGESVVFSHSFHQYLLPLPAPSGFGEFKSMQQSARIVPLMSEGSVGGVIALIEDVTERVARERALDEAKERAEAANKTKSDFLAAMSHELRTPLTAILGYADLLDSEIVGQLNEPQKEHLHRMVAGAWHLINIIEEILTFSRIEAQQYEISLAPTDVALIVKDVVSLLENQAGMKGLSIDLQLPGQPTLVETDAQRVKQILVNVIGNAIKFTDNGKVGVKLDLDDDWVRIAVTDTGPGIPEQYKNAVFEPFVQVDQSYTRRKGGTGLGLPLSRSLAELVGGSLVLESAPGKGATFVIKLPMKKVKPEPSTGG